MYLYSLYLIMVHNQQVYINLSITLIISLFNKLLSLFKVLVFWIGLYNFPFIGREKGKGDKIEGKFCLIC